MPKSEVVQVRIRPELKQEIEELKRPSKLSWQRLVEDLLESWAQEQRDQLPRMHMRNGTESLRGFPDGSAIT
jgi:hypothetical protein